ncbi:uncharacterized protein LOC142979284 [Anticarsia gemmatalis]|uniref:uncharacterized protein LOC142979284 n=1 Tax=Anticarsia gemmatalis TaxID=129554 RepID=UPI003F76C65D
MGGLQIECPLCCDKRFDSKKELLDHLTTITENLYCPICKSKLTSLESLTEHLRLYDCQTVHNDGVQNIVIYEQTMHADGIENVPNIKLADIKSLTDVSELGASDTSSEYITDQPYEVQESSGDVGNMYVDLLGKQLPKPILQTQELKLIKENGENRYVIVTQDNGELSEDNTIVTKQNNDGTISLTTVKDIKLESETLIASTTEEENNDAEIYTCNVCSVSFTSVMDHIQNYHNDQEVVVEDIPTEQTHTTEVPVEYDPLDGEETSTNDKQAPRRVITDTGDIVEESLICKENDTDQQTDAAPADVSILKAKLLLDKQGRMVHTRRVVQVEKVCTVATKNANETEKGKTDPYHKVVTKEMQTKTGFTVKMYHCMSCNINVSDLNEFQTHPCKVLKYACPRCPAAYENSRSLCAHMKVHKSKPDGSPDVPISYECEVCSTVFPTNKSLKLHKRMHDPIKSRPIEPPVESPEGKDIVGLYCCNVCDKMIPYDYRAIHEASHLTSDKMNCSICNKKFSSLEYLEMHMNVHNLDKVTVNKQDKSLPYKCLYCNRRFARPHEKVKHERIHTGEKPHSCEICGKSFRVSYCLTLHMRTHTGARPYACAHCGKRFKAHSVYNHHLLTHSEVRAYKCPFCPKAFKTSVQLAGHKNSHTKPFACTHCNRPFASLYAVRVHTETHARQNNLKFSCSLCGASYARAFALKDHIKQVHNKDEPENALPDSTNDDDWMIAENTTDTEEIQSLNKELQHDMSDLGMSANELIVP